MPLSRRLLVAMVLAGAMAGCAAPIGDRVVRLPSQKVTVDHQKALTSTLRDVAALLAEFPLPEDRRRALESLRPSSVIHEREALELTSVADTLVLAGVDADIAFASNSIIIAAGSIRIAHSENNIVVSGDDVKISHDGGSSGAGSLVVSRGRTRISHARNTLIHALDGADVSHATNVRGFNTERRKTSHGHIANIIMAPLFRQPSVPPVP